MAGNSRGNSRTNGNRAAHLKDYQFKPGQSGNPDGRPRGTKDFAELIAKETRDGEELVEYALNVLRSEQSKDTAKQWAVEYLTERMLGRTPQALDLSGEEHEDKRARAYAFYQPLTEEQVQLAERMVKALPPHENGAASKLES